MASLCDTSCATSTGWVLLREALSSRYGPLAGLAGRLDGKESVSGSLEKVQVGASSSNDESYSPQRRLGKQQVMELVERYEAGTSVVDLARDYGVHRQTVVRHLKKSGVEVRVQLKMTPERMKRATELYEEGWTTAKIGDEFGVDGSTVAYALRRAGVQMRAPVAERPEIRSGGGRI